MSNKELHIQCLNNIRKALLMIEERANVISCMDDFLQTPDGMLRLDAICMNLIALGESVKNFDKIAHHYFDIDAGIVYTTIKEDIPPLLPTIETMIKDISK